MKVAAARVAQSDAPGPGHLRVIDVDGYRVGLFNVGGRYFALADRCPHRGAPLCSWGQVVGSIIPIGERIQLVAEGEFIRCPWHKWDFEIATGRSPVASHLQVRRYAVRLDDDDIIVSLDSVKD